MTFSFWTELSYTGVIHKHFSGYLMFWVIQYISLSGSTMQSDVSLSDFCWDDWNRTQQAYIYTSVCHNLTQTFSLLNQYKLHSNLWHRIFYLIIWNLWPQCVFLKVFSLIYYLCYVICIMHAFELQFELCNSAGSSLAQDRGRLESKIEAFNSEVTILKKNLEVKLSRKITLSVLSLIC